MSWDLYDKKRGRPAIMGLPAAEARRQLAGMEMPAPARAYISASIDELVAEHGEHVLVSVHGRGAEGSSTLIEVRKAD